jgi:hypothetical protein
MISIFCISRLFPFVCCGRLSDSLVRTLSYLHPLGNLIIQWETTKSQVDKLNIRRITSSMGLHYFQVECYIFKVYESPQYLTNMMIKKFSADEYNLGDHAFHLVSSFS